ncbi:S8 family serine peptidase [Natronobacterium texcoconense]|nr:S8 family serine peptidase [Natronobacterium texcoconense]
MAAVGASGGQAEATTSDEQVDASLADVDGETKEIVLRFGSADGLSSMSEDEAIAEMQRHAEVTQAEAIQRAEQTDGIEVKNDFWIANAVLLEVDPGEVDLKAFVEGTGAVDVHENFEVELVDDTNGTETTNSSDDESVTNESTDETANESADEPVSNESADETTNETVDSSDDESVSNESTSETANETADVGDEPADADEAATVTAENVTYGLEMINATDVWDEHGTQGTGAGVAVLDTGIEDAHPDLEIAPDNWQEFDASGDPVETEPNDGNGHGTHVSGTVVGPDDPDGDVPAYGVAPEAELYHGKVLDDAGGGSFAQIVAGMEWAVDDTDADVVTMSLGFDNYESEMLEPSENAREAGVVLVASIGNDGQGVSGSPGNVYPNFASGAVDENAEVASFSSGEVVETEHAYPDAPDYWPDEYVVPNAGAPGVNVLSAVPDGGYDDTYSGTSMSAPHKAGMFALMVSASDGEADREQLYEIVEDTAWQPEHADEDVNTEYGHGIVDAAAATELVVLDSGIDGTVTDTDGTAIEGATVELEDRTTNTDDTGQYSHIAAPGEYTVTADAFGYESASEGVTVEENETTTQDFELSDALDGEVAEYQPDGIEAGDELETTVTVANAETVTVDFEGDYDESDATLYVDGEQAEFGEAVDLDGPVSDDVTISVETTEDTEGELELENTFAGMGDEITVRTGSTTVFEEFVPVAVVDDDGFHGDDVVSALDEELPAMYDPGVTTSGEAMEDYEVIVVQSIDDTAAGDFIEETDGSDTGVVYLDQWGADSNGIPVHSDVMDDPEATFQDDFVVPPITYELNADHEIFEGVGEAGDSVDIHNAAFGDHTWFEGTDADVLAETGVQGAPVGDGFAVDDESATVYASSLGYTTFVGSADYTENADAILGNSVEYVASTEETESEEVLTFGDGEHVGPTNGTVDVELNTTADGVAGYETQVHFDADVLQVEDVEGVDMDDPITSIDNDEGTVSLAQAQANDVSEPTFAEIEFAITAETNGTDLVFDEEETYLNDAHGDLEIELVNGTVESAWLGDVNADGDVNTYDVTLTQQYLAGEEPTDTFHEDLADMNGNGEIGPGDVTMMLEQIVEA